MKRDKNALHFCRGFDSHFLVRVIRSFESRKDSHESVLVCSRCEEATEVETHHQQTAATAMGVAEDETPSSLTTSHPNTNNPNQEGKSTIIPSTSIET